MKNENLERLYREKFLPLYKDGNLREAHEILKTNPNLYPELPRDQQEEIGRYILRKIKENSHSSKRQLEMITGAKIE